MPRYRAVINCTDFDGRFYRQGEIVDLPEGKHSDWLVPLDALEPVETLDEEPETANEEQETANEEPETANEEPETVDAQPGTIAKYTEETLKPLTKAQLVDLGQEEFGLSLSAKSKEADIIAAILAAQESGQAVPGSTGE